MTPSKRPCAGLAPVRRDAGGHHISPRTPLSKTAHWLWSPSSSAETPQIRSKKDNLSDEQCSSAPVALKGIAPKGRIRTPLPVDDN